MSHKLWIINYAKKYLQLISDRGSISFSTNILCKSCYFFIILSNFGCIWSNNTCKSLIVHGCTRTTSGCEWRCAELRSGIAKISPAITHSLIRFLFGVVEKSNFLLFFLGFYFLGRGPNQWTKSKKTWVGMWHGERLVRVGSCHWAKIFFIDDSLEIIATDHCMLAIFNLDHTVIIRTNLNRI